MIGALLLAATLADTVVFKGPPGSVTPSLAVSAGGGLIATWLEPMKGEGRYALRFAATRDGKTWSAPGTIRESDRFFVNWADFASLVETRVATWIAHWPEKTAALPYAYHVMVSTSRDRGKSWTPPRRLHDDTSATEHGFVAASPGASGADLIWLDGRNTGGESGEMTVRTRAMAADGSLGRELELDARTCECCQAALARTPDGLVAAWRDRSATEVRDIAVARQENGRWSKPQVVSADSWEHRACPVNGPALVADGRRVDLVWFTGVGNQNRVWLVRSTDGAKTFGSRIRIDEGQTLGRLDAEPLGDGSLLVAWLEGKSDAVAEWRIRRITTDGKAGQSRAVASVTRARLAGFPRLARSGGTTYLAYTATGTDGGVRIIRLE